MPCAAAEPVSPIRAASSPIVTVTTAPMAASVMVGHSAENASAVVSG